MSKLVRDLQPGDHYYNPFTRSFVTVQTTERRKMMVLVTHKEIGHPTFLYHSREVRTACSAS